MTIANIKIKIFIEPRLFNNNKTTTNKHCKLKNEFL